MNPVIQALPDHKRRVAPNYLYAVQFSDGLLKVGVTKNPVNRVGALQCQRKRRVVRAEAVGFSGGYRHAAERDALVRLRRMGVADKSGTEVFWCVSFGAAVNVLRQVARRKYQFQPAPSHTPEGRRAARLRKRGDA